MRTDVHSRSPRRRRHHLDHIAQWQLACVLLLIGLIWANEAFDFDGLLLGKPSPGQWSDASFLTLGVIAVGSMAFMPIYSQKKALLRETVTVCSYCRSVQVNKKAWKQIETYFAERTLSVPSHGVCPECHSKVMHDYRAGRKDAGARETIFSEMAV